MRLIQLMLPAVALCALGGCATKGYVDESVSRIEARQILDERQLNELSTTSRQALERANDAGALARGKFLYDVVLTEDDIAGFGSDDMGLSNESQQRLAALAEQLKSDNRNVFLEIQGHTDATGPANYNEALGLQRAESVRRYLYSQGVALGRMATISYGEEAPVAPNDTPDGRANNRRVAVVVLE
ncbi:MAG: OmpA family protein [Pseudomonadota bacterium]